MEAKSRGSKTSQCTLKCFKEIKPVPVSLFRKICPEFGKKSGKIREKIGKNLKMLTFSGKSGKYREKIGKNWTKFRRKKIIHVVTSKSLQKSGQIRDKMPEIS